MITRFSCKAQLRIWRLWYVSLPISVLSLSFGSLIAYGGPTDTTESESFGVFQRDELQERLSAWDSRFESSYVYRMRPDSSGTCLFVHCKPRDASTGGYLVRINDGKITLLHTQLPAQNVWWDNSGNIIAYSDKTPYSGKAIGHKSVQLGLHTVQIKGAIFDFGSGDTSTLFDISEDGNWIYVFEIYREIDGLSSSKSNSVRLRISNSQQPGHVLFEANYPKIPSLFLRGETLHVFSQVNEKYGCRKYLQEKLEVRDGKLIPGERVQVAARDTLFSSHYRISTLSSDSKFLFIFCSVDMPFSAKSHIQQISLSGTHTAERIRTIPNNVTISPVNWENPVKAVE